MKWGVVLLLIANVALYLWAGGGIERAGSVKPEVNKEGMRLLGEPQSAGADSAATSPDGAQARSARTGQAALSCYRLGPFKDEAARSAAARWMSSRQLTYRAVRSESREMRAVRVYLGPFDTLDAAGPAMRGLKEKAIDHFVDPEARGQVYVSLGYFSQEALAVKFVAHLLTRGIDAKSRAEYRAMGPFDWMEAAVDTTRRDLLLARRWPEKGVTVFKIGCDEALISAQTGG